MFCVGCGETIPDDSKFCIHCGAGAVVIERVCDNARCSTPLPEGVNQCPSCGKQTQGVMRKRGESAPKAKNEPSSSGSADFTESIFCPSCGKELSGKSRFCRYCGNDIPDKEEQNEPEGSKVVFCWSCGKEIESSFQFCPFCETPQADAEAPAGVSASRTMQNGSQGSLSRQGAAVNEREIPAMGEKGKVAAGLLGIFLGVFCVHKFYLGYNQAGGIMVGAGLGCLIFAFFLPVFVLGFFAVWVIGLIEGIVYLTKSEQEFYNTYVVGKREWF